MSTELVVATDIFSKAIKRKIFDFLIGCEKVSDKISYARVVTIRGRLTYACKKWSPSGVELWCGKGCRCDGELEAACRRCAVASEVFERPCLISSSRVGAKESDCILRVRKQILKALDLFVRFQHTTEANHT